MIEPVSVGLYVVPLHVPVVPDESLQGKFVKPVPVQNESKSPPAGIAARACWIPASAAYRATVPPLRLAEALRLRLLKRRPAPVIDRRTTIIISTIARLRPRSLCKIVFTNHHFILSYEGNPRLRRSTLDVTVALSCWPPNCESGFLD